MGLVDEMCATGALDETAAPIVEDILAGGPGALKDTKRLVQDIGRLAVDDVLAEELSRVHALKRQTEEADEGLRSFVEKRNPNWYPGER